MRRTSNHSQQGLLRKDSYAVLEVLRLALFDLSHSKAVTWRLVCKSVIENRRLFRDE